MALTQFLPRFKILAEKAKAKFSDWIREVGLQTIGVWRKLLKLFLVLFSKKFFASIFKWLLSSVQLKALYMCVFEEVTSLWLKRNVGLYANSKTKCLLHFMFVQNRHSIFASLCLILYCYLYVSNYPDPRRGGGLMSGSLAILVEDPCSTLSRTPYPSTLLTTYVVTLVIFINLIIDQSSKFVVSTFLRLNQ